MHVTFYLLCPQNFQSDISGMCVEGVLTGEHTQQLNSAICEHLVRQGKLDVGEKLVEVRNRYVWEIQFLVDYSNRNSGWMMSFKV